MAITETSPETDAPTPPEEQLLEQSGTGGTDHKVIGTLFIAAALVFLVVGGALAGVMRAQLSGPDVDIVGGGGYRLLFTMHGVIMVFLFLLPMWLGLASAMVPLQIGATRMAFPRLHALSLWMFLGGAGMVVAAPFVSDVISGWDLSRPIPEGYAVAAGNGPDLLILGLLVVAVAAIVAAVNLIVTILQLRAPGLTAVRLPMFSWTVAVSSSVMLLALPVLVGALLMLFVDRHYAGPIFSGFTGSRGGNPLLWPRLFWFAAYPLLWALLLPALGVIADIVPVLTRGPLFRGPRRPCRDRHRGPGLLRLGQRGAEPLPGQVPLRHRRPGHSRPPGAAGPEPAGQPGHRRPHRPRPAQTSRITPRAPRGGIRRRPGNRDGRRRGLGPRRHRRFPHQLLVGRHPPRPLLRPGHHRRRRRPRLLGAEAVGPQPVGEPQPLPGAGPHRRFHRDVPAHVRARRPGHGHRHR